MLADFRPDFDWNSIGRLLHFGKESRIEWKRSTDSDDSEWFIITNTTDHYNSNIAAPNMPNPPMATLEAAFPVSEGAVTLATGFLPPAVPDGAGLKPFPGSVAVPMTILVVGSYKRNSLKST